MTTRPKMDLGDYVAELTRPHKHREHYTQKVGLTPFTQDHVTDVPPLIVQLLYASPSGRGEELGGGGYESRPAASLESLTALSEIDLQAARWVRDLGEDDPGDRWDPATQRFITGSGTIRCLQLLNGLAASADGTTQRAIEKDVKRWYVKARILTGWDSPAWRPDNTCPMCDARGTLRVKLVESYGFCTDCGDTWDETTIGHLADHIRDESAGIRSVPQAVFCWCAWPRPLVDAWPSLCPVCASPWCHRAGWVKSLEGPTESPQHAFAQDAG